MIARLKDVAEEAGVSRALVSMYLNHRDAGHMTDLTRTRIREAVHRLGYKPNQVARGLRTNRTHLIGYIGSDMTNETRQRQMVLFHEELERRGYRMLMAYGYGDNKFTQQAFEMMLRNGCDGVIVNQTSATALSLENMDVSVVFCSRHPPVSDTANTIFCDFSTGMTQELDFLESLGHKEIYLVWSQYDWDPLDGRLVTFARRYPRNILRIAEARGGVSLDSFRQARQEHPAATAYVCISDITAVSVLGNLETLGIRVPQEVSVCGWDNDRFSAPLGLSTVETPLAELASSTIDMLLNRLQNRTAEVKTRIESRFLPRKTTGEVKLSP